VDASKYAVGAALEQLIDEERCPTKEDVLKRKTVPVAFMSRKLTRFKRNWVPREQETYAIILALLKWQSWKGLREVLVLSDHKALESWYNEHLDTPSGPLGRRGRWHEIFSRFYLRVEYLPGEDNLLPDALSRWAYPASQALADLTKHGSVQDDLDMQALIEEEEADEILCMVVILG